jgi:Raf kinase inhibitor-like YbhB/YbcL family protein
MCLALAATVTVLAACDTDDGREMQTPDSYAAFQLQNTTPSTTSTVAPPPTEFVATPATTSATSGTSSTSTSTASTASTAATASTVSVSQQVETSTPGSAVTGVGPLQFTGPWDNGAAIPVEFTCDGADDVPLITWTGPPAGTAEMALSVVDPDANGFVHWLVIGLPAEAGSVGGGEPLVAGAAEATNGFGGPGWGGPCPPPGDGPHNYQFTLHVLDQAIELPADTPTSELLVAVNAATASSATFTGTYERV